MAMSLQEMSDRMEIADTTARYSYVVDQRVWDEWDRVFLDTATIDYSFWGMEPCSPAMLRDSMKVSHARRISGQHLLHHQLIELDGDVAQVHTEFTLNVITEADEQAISHRRTTGGWYEDEVVRTAAGWRIRTRHGFGKWLLYDDVAAQTEHAHQPWLIRGI